MGDQFWSVKITFLLLFIPITFCARSEFSTPDGMEIDLPELIVLVESWGYPIKQHWVVTEDDYILTVFRLPNEESTKPPVYLQHGLTASSAAYLTNRQGLGYDVWLANTRGSKFSRKHRFFQSNSAEFWNFSFHEMGLYDLPAVLHHITDVTGRSKVHFVGHSMGTTMFLVMASKKPYLLEHIQSITLMAPVAVPMHMSPFSSPVIWFFSHLATQYLPLIITSQPHLKLLAAILYKTCREDSYIGILCRMLKGDKEKHFKTEKEQDATVVKIWHSNESEDSKTIIETKQVKVKANQFDYENAKTAVDYMMDGTSWKTHLHFLQIIKAERFQQFDYQTGNPPPKYPIRSINKRIFLISGGLDSIAHSEDVLWLAKRLRDPWLVEEGFEDFDHIAFHYGKGIPIVVQTVTRILKASEYGRDPELPRTEIPEEEKFTEESEENPKPKSSILDRISSFLGFKRSVKN